MKRFLLFSFIFILVLSACDQPYEQSDSQSTFTSIPPDMLFATAISTKEATLAPANTPTPSRSLYRGVNFGNMLEPPNEGEWGLYVLEEYFDLVKEAGFDFVRLPVSWDAHADGEEPYTIDPEFFFRVDQVVEWGLERNLTIILDFHNYDEMMSNPWGMRNVSLLFGNRFRSVTRIILRISCLNCSMNRIPHSMPSCGINMLVKH